MTFTEITFEYCQGKVFVCKPKIENLEVELDSKMKGKIVGVSQPDEDDVVLVVIDTSDFVDHNNFYAKSNYWGLDGKACYTAREAEWWPEDEKHDVYFMANDLFEDYFEEVV
jgi:hypothetical protein